MALELNRECRLDEAGGMCGERPFVLRVHATRILFLENQGIGNEIN